MRRLFLLLAVGVLAIAGASYSAGPVAQWINISIFGRSLVDDADASTARTTLGLGTMATAASGDYAALAANNTFTANQTLQISDDGAGQGPVLLLERISASPAASDKLGFLSFYGRSSTGSDRGYNQLWSEIIDPTDGSEDGRYVFQGLVAGSGTTLAKLGPGLTIGAPTGGDQGAGTINATGLYVNGVAVGSGVSDGDKTDITVSSSGATWTIDNNVISNAKFRQSSGLSVVGNSTNSTANVADITAANDGEILRRSGTSIGFGTVATAGLANDAVTYAKLQNVSATDKLLARVSASAGDVEEVDFSDLAQTLVGHTTAAQMRGDILADWTSPLAQSTVSISGTATATISRLNVCTGSSAYVVTLPASSGNSGATIHFLVATTSNAIVTLDGNSAETINGYATRDYVAGEICSLYCDGSNWTVLHETLKPISFQARQSGTQSVTGSSVTVLALAATNYNIGSAYDTSTKKFTPKAPGLYQFNVSFSLDSLADGKLISPAVRLNGSTNYWTCFVRPGSAGQSAVSGTIVLPMNGSTDYVEAIIYHEDTTSRTTTNETDGSYTKFEGRRVSRERQ